MEGTWGSVVCFADESMIRGKCISPMVYTTNGERGCRTKIEVVGPGKVIEALEIVRSTSGSIVTESVIRTVVEEFHGPTCVDVLESSSNLVRVCTMGGRTLAHAASLVL